LVALNETRSRANIIAAVLPQHRRIRCHRSAHKRKPQSARDLHGLAAISQQWRPNRELAIRPLHDSTPPDGPTVNLNVENGPGAARTFAHVADVYHIISL
jgi:hypothetical protein